MASLTTLPTEAPKAPAFKHGFMPVEKTYAVVQPSPLPLFTHPTRPEYPLIYIAGTFVQHDVLPATPKSRWNMAGGNQYGSLDWLPR